MAAELVAGVLKDFDATPYTARVTLTGSVHLSLSDVPVSRAIASGEMVADRKVLVAIVDRAKATDAVVVAVWT